MSVSQAHPRRAEQVASDIEHEIIAAGWPVGRMFGSEGELVEKHRVSRAIFREAVRLLEHRQVAHMRRGPGGGLIVTAPGPDAATEALATYLEYVGTSFEDLVEVRSVLEPLAARLAAETVSERAIDELRRSLEAHQGGSEPEDPFGHYDVHAQLAELSHNPVLFLFLQVLLELSRRAVVEDAVGDEYLAQIDAETYQAHRSMVEAVIAGEAAEAAATAREHVLATGRWYRMVHSQSADGSTGRIPVGVAKQAKRAEVVAAKLKRKIIERGWQVGEFLGSESDLAEEFGLSHAVLTEAVRILEHHNIVSVRRGRNGGLVISAPDPVALADAVSRYIEFAGFAEADLHVVRQDLELHCIDVLVSRPPDSNDRNLRQLLTVGPVTPPDEINIFSHDLHVGIALASGNPILHVFVQVLTNLCAWHCAPPENAPAYADIARAAVETSHGRIVEAILASDRAVARHRMIRHLEALRRYWDQARTPSERYQAR